MKYKKTLGQHILHGKGILEKIVGGLGDISNEIVVEIGGGTGNLTEVLSQKIFPHRQLVRPSEADSLRLALARPSLRSGHHARSGSAMRFKKIFCDKNKTQGKFIVYEIDKDLAEGLKNKFENIEVKNENFLDADLSKFKNDYLLIGNIPYFITGQILRKIFTLQNYPKIAVLTISKEQGEKLIGLPHKNFFSNWINIWGKISKICAIKAGSFFPPPKVDSIVIRIEFYKKPLVENPENFAKFLKILFKQPKQTIYNNLKNSNLKSCVINTYIIIAHDLDGLKKLRPHQLKFEEILELYRKFN